MNERFKRLMPLVPLYATGLAAKEKLLAKGVLRARRLEWPVVSVGSLSAGGAGKTPVVIALAELLRERGWAVDVLTRGYGRKGRDVARVKADGENPAWWFGDEPVLIEQRTGVPVWVGAERFAAGRMAEAAEERREADSSDAPAGDRPGRVHLLDDGFQHRQLARTVDVVLVTEEDLDDLLLPAGNLRELPKALARADVVVLREDERERVEPRVRQWMRADAALWAVRRDLRFPHGVKAVLRPVGFCAIARPDGFWAMVDDAGCALAGRIAFEDHHQYDRADIERLVQLAVDSGANGFLTTEKDAVKLSSSMLEELRAVGPVNVAALDAKFVDPGKVALELEARLK